jgi:hypothetical protein
MQIKVNSFLLYSKMEEIMFKNRREVFERKFWNLTFVLVFVLFTFLPVFSKANLLNLNDNSSLMKTETSKEDTSTAKNQSFWKKLSFGIGYSGGLCFAGEDFRSNDYIPFPTIYWTNSIEGKAMNLLSKNNVIEVRVGLGFTRLSVHSGSQWRFTMFSCGIGNIFRDKGNGFIGFEYIYSLAAEIRSYNRSNGSGHGFKFLADIRWAKKGISGIRFSYGKIFFNEIANNNPIVLDITGFHILIAFNNFI